MGRLWKGGKEESKSGDEAFCVEERNQAWQPMRELVSVTISGKLSKYRDKLLESDKESEELSESVDGEP